MEPTFLGGLICIWEAYIVAFHISGGFQLQQRAARKMDQINFMSFYRSIKWRSLNARSSREDSFQDFGQEHSSENIV